MTREDLIKLTQSPSEGIRQKAIELLRQRDEAKAVSKSADFSELINDVNKLIEEAKKVDSGGVNKTEVNKLIDERIKSLNLSSASENVTYDITRDDEVVYSGTFKDKRRLFFVLLSDQKARLNSYLYGEAGTGKTYMAGQIADAINYKLITLNCNQFTSPTDIIGGQTIEGYQEGRLIEAWANLNLGENKDCKPYDGALLLLDELPKLDPNTAGLLNDALSKIKDGDKDGTNCATGEKKKYKPRITNGRGEQFELKNLYVIATGNSLLNEANKDYEANFKQDLSLQDRFAGSCYRVTYNYRFEYELLSKFKYNLTFVFNFLAVLRQKINEANLNGVAFVSTRLMVSYRDTFNAYIENRQTRKIIKPKTLADATASFLSLFSEEQRDGLIKSMQKEYDDFLATAEKKQEASVTELKKATAKETALAEAIIEEAERKQKAKQALEL